MIKKASLVNNFVWNKRSGKETVVKSEKKVVYIIYSVILLYIILA